MNTRNASGWLPDLIVVLRGIWILLIFDLAAFFLFVKTTQGADVILCMVEDLGNRPVLPLTFIFMQIGLLCWAVSSELTCRWMVYLTDNSGKALSPDRVTQRKRIQRRVARYSLFYPYVVFAIALIGVITNGKVKLNGGEQFAVFLMFLAGVLWIALLYWLYISSRRLVVYNKWPLKWLVPQGNELIWSNKLYGIYSDVRINMSTTVATEFKPGPLPTSEVLPDGTTLPAPVIDPVTGQPDPDTTFRYMETVTDSQNNLRIWLYQIPRRFYPHLLHQLYLCTGIALAIIITFLLMPVNYAMNIGTAAIATAAFACWQMIVVFVHYLNSIRYRWFIKIPVGLVLLILFLISSFYNDDHPVRQLYKVRTAKRASLQDHFRSWCERLVKDRDNVYTIGANRDIIPVLFIAAEGGALRTGAFTALTLAALDSARPLLTKHIYCYSTVSGGSVGANVFNSLSINKRIAGDTNSLTPAVRTFFEHDHLSAVISRMFFGEIVNYFLPQHVEQFDRAIALEKSWEYSMGDSNKEQKGKVNLLNNTFESTIGSSRPALFINTTEVETGLQCIWSNVDISALPRGEERDLYRVTGMNLRYSTAINLSSRFPLVSPGASLCYRNEAGSCRQRHYVDGGYYENKGAETLLQVLNVLPLEQYPIKVYVIQFNFGDSTAVDTGTIRKFSELSEIIAGMYNTRVSRTSLGQDFLQLKVKGLGARGDFKSIVFGLEEGQCPNNWVLSQAAVREVRSKLDGVIRNQLSFSDWNVPKHAKR